MLESLALLALCLFKAFRSLRICSSDIPNRQPKPLRNESKYTKAPLLYLKTFSLDYFGFRLGFFILLAAPLFEALFELKEILWQSTQIGSTAD